MLTDEKKFTRRIEELGILHRQMTSCSIQGTASNGLGVLFVSNTFSLTSYPKGVRP